MRLLPGSGFVSPSAVPARSLHVRIYSHSRSPLTSLAVRMGEGTSASFLLSSFIFRRLDVGGRRSGQLTLQTSRGGEGGGRTLGQIGLEGDVVAARRCRL